MTLTTERIDALESLAKRHGALSYRNRADTANPAFGFSVAGLAALLAEARRDALEEAARVILETKEWKNGKWTSTICPTTQEAIAAAIRKLKEDVQ